MSAFGERFAGAVAGLFLEAAPYLLLGFLVAGLLKVFVPARLIARSMGGNRFRSVFFATLFGAPIPLCSCSVLPMATALRRAGAGKGATASFLISTPETGVDSVSVTWALFDPIMTLARPLVAVTSALFTGSWINALVRRGWDVAPAGPIEIPAVETACGRAAEGDPCGAGAERAHEHAGHAHELDAEDAWEERARAARSLGARARLAVRYAFGPLLDDLTAWLIVGFLVSGAIAAALPDDFFTTVVPRGWPALLVMAAIGTPLYVCATASTPIAAAMVAKGLEPGAALVFLLVGPALSAATLGVVSRLLGRRAFGLYLGGIVFVALLAGWGLNELYAGLGIDLPGRLEAARAEGPSAVAVAGALALLGALAASARRIGLGRQASRALARALGGDPGARWPQVALALGALALWGASAFTALAPGETAFRMRFGRLAEVYQGGGLRAHMPWPIDRIERARPLAVESVVLGFREGELAAGEGLRQRAADLQAELDLEAEMLTGDGTLLSISFAVHYRQSDARAARVHLRDPAALVRALAESAVRNSVLARASSGEVLAGARSELEEEARRALQADLERLASGLEVVGVRLRDVHAPSDVHSAYRDVASALEDRERSVHEAEGQAAEELASARAVAWSTEQEARAGALGETSEAAGRKTAFEALAEAAAAAPELTHLRLRLEALEAALADARTTLVLTDDVEIELFDQARAGAVPGAAAPAPELGPPAGQGEPH